MTNMISVIITLYNKKNSIKKCIESVLKQTYTNWELIIIDDGSTDCPSEIIIPYILVDKRIKYTYKDNGGVSSARNLGITKAQGKWIIFIDADDYFLPDALQTLLNLVIQNNVLIGVGNFFLEKDKKKYIMCVGQSRIVKNNFRSWYFLTCFPRTGNTLFEASIFNKHSFNESLHRYEDAEFIFKVMSDYKFAYTNQIVFTYSQDNPGLSKKAEYDSYDYIFSLNFSSKSFWERIVLAHLLNEGLRLYKEKKDILLSKYSGLFWLTWMERLLRFYAKIYRKILLLSCLN